MPKLLVLVIQCCYSFILSEGEPTHRPTDFEKKMLVYTKTYAKVEDIPEKVRCVLVSYTVYLLNSTFINHFFISNI